MREDPTTQHAAMRELGQAISALDRMDDLINADWYVELRRQLINVYLDILADALKPFDQELSTNVRLGELDLLPKHGPPDSDILS